MDPPKQINYCNEHYIQLMCATNERMDPNVSLIIPEYLFKLYK